MNGKRINFDVPTEVHRGFKSFCARTGTTMRHVLLEVVYKIHKQEISKKRNK